MTIKMNLVDVNFITSDCCHLHYELLMDNVQYEIGTLARIGFKEDKPVEFYATDVTESIGGWFVQSYDLMSQASMEALMMEHLNFNMVSKCARDYAQQEIDKENKKIAAASNRKKDLVLMYDTIINTLDDLKVERMLNENSGQIDPSYS